MSTKSFHNNNNRLALHFCWVLMMLVEQKVNKNNGSQAKEVWWCRMSSNVGKATFLQKERTPNPCCSNFCTTNMCCNRFVPTVFSSSHPILDSSLGVSVVVFGLHLLSCYSSHQSCRLLEIEVNLRRKMHSIEFRKIKLRGKKIKKMMRRRRQRRVHHNEGAWNKIEFIYQTAMMQWFSFSLHGRISTRWWIDGGRLFIAARENSFSLKGHGSKRSANKLAPLTSSRGINISSVLTPHSSI